MTKASPTRAARKSNRTRLPVEIRSINKPDPDITAAAFAPLLLDWLKRDRARRGGCVDPGAGAMMN